MKDKDLSPKGQKAINDEAARNIAYSANNNEISVEDLGAGFDISLLSEKKVAEYQEFWGNKEPEKKEETKAPEVKEATEKK